MRRSLTAFLILTGALGAMVPLVSMPRAAAQVRDQRPTGATVVGVVTRKFVSANDSYLIEVNGKPYQVPPDFYVQAQVGQVVQFDGLHWSVLNRNR